jgi:hypothetical protein
MREPPVDKLLTWVLFPVDDILASNPQAPRGFIEGFCGEMAHKAMWRIS